ncbi:polysaccharide biosynthesis protein, partial [Staphylococcus sp. EG-SA-17]|uniref:polysaccharide biosynthesis protein n=1 Tax=Staphylococcus sp. EG-SA-17 TaxID=2767493 RepID=UPI001F121C9C
VELVVHAFKHAETGDIMVQKAPSSTVGDLATALLELFEADNAAKDVWINGFTPQYTMSVWMGFSKVKQYGENSFVGHSQQ